MSEPTLGDAYDAMGADAQKRGFLLLFAICEFYASGDTWFATALVPDHPAGLINADIRFCEDLHRRAPGGRARLAFSWVLSSMRRALADADGGKGE